MDEETAKKLVRDAIAAGVFNDLGSGSNIDLCVIKKGSVDYLRGYEYANKKGVRSVGLLVLLGSFYLSFVCSFQWQCKSIFISPAPQLAQLWLQSRHNRYSPNIRSALCGRGNSYPNRIDVRWCYSNGYCLMHTTTTTTSISRYHWIENSNKLKSTRFRLFLQIRLFIS